VVNADQAGALRAIAGKVSNRSVDLTPAIDSTVAIKAALAVIARKYKVLTTELHASHPQQWIYDPLLVGLPNRGAGLVWRTTVTAPRNARIDEVVLVDAKRGSITLAYSQVHGVRNRTTYDTNFTGFLPGTLQ